MQIVYLSNRPEVLRHTLAAVSRHMTFVDRVLLTVPRADEDRFRFVGEIYPYEVVHDEALIDTGGRVADHAVRNYLLRTVLCDHPALADEFIMSDDDYRPLTNVDTDFFKSAEGYRSYYFYHLGDWTYDDTEFDRGQQNTYQLLRYLGYDQIGYASHMPQIVRKDLLKACKERFAPYAEGLGLCEWSVYFNYAQRHHAGLFAPPEPYRTLCWPDCVTCWPRAVAPEDYVFENYSPRLYADGGPFGPSARDQWGDGDARFHKTLAWYRHELQVMHGRAADTDTALRRALHRLVRPIRRLKDILWLRERTQMLRLEHRLRRLEDRLGPPR